MRAHRILYEAFIENNVVLSTILLNIQVVAWLNKEIRVYNDFKRALHLMEPEYPLKSVQKVCVLSVW